MHVGYLSCICTVSVYSYGAHVDRICTISCSYPPDVLHIMLIMDTYRRWVDMLLYVPKGTIQHTTIYGISTMWSTTNG